MNGKLSPTQADSLLFLGPAEEDRMATNHEQVFAPRLYQLEILDEALKKNVIACLGTGTGKTFISVMLIKELAHQIKGKLKQGGKRTFFVVNTGR